MSPAAPDLERLFNPRAVAVVGASADAGRIGGQPIGILADAGYTGPVYPVNPKYRDIAGHACYPDVGAVPKPCDVAIVAVAAALVPQVIEDCGRAGIPFAVVFSAGFREVGPDGAALEARLKEAIAASGVQVVGPNCIGLMNLSPRVYMGFGPGFRNTTLASGPVAMVSQSGGFAFSVAALADDEGVGFQYIVSAGNEVGLTSLDFMAAFLERDDVEIVVSYLEGVQDGRRLREIGRRSLELGKPILVWKVGNSAPGRAAAESHTASMTADYALYRAAFREGGFIEIEDVHDLVDRVRAFLGRRLPRGRDLALITTSGGSAVMMVDVADRYGLKTPPLTDATLAALRAIAPPYASLANPIDLTAQLSGNWRDFNRMAGLVLADPGIDQLIVRYGAVQGAGSEDWARGIAALAAEHDKPVFVAWSRVPDRGAPSLALLERERVPWALTPVRCAHAAGALAEFAARRRALSSRHAAPRLSFPQPLDCPDGRHTLGEHESKRLLAAYGVPVVKDVLVAPADIDTLAAAPLPFPLAVKVASPDIAHKTEAGAVRLNVRSLDELKAAAHEVIANARRYHSGARIDGVLLAEMVAGTEVIVGAVNDPCFGPVVMFGLGGVFTELLRDVTYRFAPFGVETAREMIAEIRTAPLLRGYRGAPPLAVDALAVVLARVSELAADHAGRIAEIDVNPVFVDERSAKAADALVILKPVA
jgi:acyl-CoA synthetase (NDP forming)